MNRRLGQSGSVMKTKGKWYGRYYEYPPDGKRTRPSVPLGSVKELCKSQALRKLRAHLEQIGINSDVPLPKPAICKTFGGHYEWWESNKLALCKLSYQQKVGAMVKTHILPYFESTPVDTIGQDRVQEFIATLNRTEYTTRDGVKHKLSAIYIRDTVSLLGRILGKQASDWKLTLPEVPFKEQRYFTEDEMSRIIGAAFGRWKTLFALLAGTGLRCGEAFGLHVEDLNLECRQLTVRRSIYRGIESTPKTRRAYRTVDISTELRQMLRQHLEDRTSGYVFETENSTPLSQQNSRRMLHTILDRLGIPKGGLHAFRHGRVSVLQAGRVPGDLIKQWVGHTSLKVTSRYTHFEEKFRQKEAERAGLLAQKTPGNGPISLNGPISDGSVGYEGSGEAVAA